VKYLGICPRCGSIRFTEQCTTEYETYYDEEGYHTHLIDRYDCDIFCTHCDYDYMLEIPIEEDKYIELVKIRSNEERLLETVRYVSHILKNKYREIEKDTLLSYINFLNEVINTLNKDTLDYLKRRYEYTINVAKLEEVYEYVKSVAKQLMTDEKFVNYAKSLNIEVLFTHLEEEEEKWIEEEEEEE